MGNQTTDLLCQIHYQPSLKVHYYYEPNQIHYIPIRNNHIDVMETQVRESENNELAQFPKDGTSIGTFHFRRIK